MAAPNECYFVYEQDIKCKRAGLARKCPGCGEAMCSWHMENVARLPGKQLYIPHEPEAHLTEVAR